MTNRPAVDAEEEIERVVPLVERRVRAVGGRRGVRRHLQARGRGGRGRRRRVDRQRHQRPARSRARGRVRAHRRRARPHAHARGAEDEGARPRPRTTTSSPTWSAFLRERMDVAASRGVAEEQILIDPGPDFAKTPAQTVEVLARLEELHVLERPILLAISRKDALGAIDRRGPRERLAGTLAALGRRRRPRRPRGPPPRRPRGRRLPRRARRAARPDRGATRPAAPEQLRRVAPSDGPGR